MMEEYTKSEGYTQTRSLYAGHYLDYVVTPIYEIVAKVSNDETLYIRVYAIVQLSIMFFSFSILQSMKSNKDHMDTLNYDDYNEFFWSRNCLGYRYSSSLVSDDVDVEGMGGLAGPLPGEELPSIAEGLVEAPKTFLEKRSWLRGMLALNRVLEWHIVTFYLLSVVAFARELVWGWVYSVEVASGVFWIFNVLHLFWGLVEVWGSYPGIHLSGTAVCGSVFTLTARFLILVYQSLYLMWAFSPQKGGVYLGIEADSTFWWWQYVWISLLCMIPYAVEALIQLWPALSTKIYTSSSDYIQSFLNILYPLSRLYVGKEVHESLKHSAVYFFYWGTLIIWKLFFSYVFEVYSMVLPTLQLTDDFQNYPDQSFAKMGLLLFMRWLPQFIVYCIDMSIWYAAWQAFAGTSVGFSEHLGDIRSMSDIRENFGSAPENFCLKMLSPDAGSRRGSSASFLGSSGTNLANAEGQSLLGTDPHKLQSYVNRILDVRIQKWVMFSAAWNNIIDHFRDEDIVSNWEQENLKFSTFDGFSQAIYLPAFQTAGVIDNVLSELERPFEESNKTGTVTDEEFFKPIMQHVTMRTAVSEVWELGSYVFSQMLGPVHQSDVTVIMSTVLKWSENGTLSSHLRLPQMRKVMSQYVGMIELLEKGLSDRTPSSKPRSWSSKKNKISEAPPSTGMRRAVSATSLASLEKKKPTADDTQSAETNLQIIDALRDQVRDKFRNLAYALKGLLRETDIDPESRDVLDRITFLLSMENGFLWDDAYASDQLDAVTTNSIFRAVLKKSHGLVACHPDDVEPKSKEVRRRLTWFTNTLFMDMPFAPSIHDMFSWTTLTPYYSEDVTYTRGDLEKRTDTLGVSTLLYLQTLFRSDWNNFLERLGIEDEEKIWSKKYIDETRKWASMRAQTLSRTVHGMMYYEKALRLLADMERIDEDTTNDLMGEKFGYVVSCQVYGNMKRNQDKKADDIDHLMFTYPHLRVAYIDNIRLNRAGSSIYYSVLVKSNGKGKIEEVYRVRLPGNPVIGEGKPENQNHAMIFTRSEFLQTIDMNQEGYFEEALKMRNLLQEFAKREGPLPTTILGFREHIFTGSVSSLANYMALQEMSFVTLGQRVLTKPVHMRLHYGHPDLFDKLFAITRGGISKASKGINLSEDVFAGYNNVIRGGSVGFKEYIQVGKGRDVGMSQIYKFEAKLSQGAAEQSLSRDMYRMCQRLDFCRLLGFYFGGIGHYFSNVLTVLTVYVVVYLMVLLAIFDLEKIGDRMITPMGTIQMLLGGLGLLQTVPLFAALGVERGWVASVQEIFQVFVTGGPLHFMFHIQTKAYFMSQTILAGGAKYRATGRGFVTQHTQFDEQYRFFASSHLYLGIELASGLVLMGVYTSAGQYFGRTWSLWLASLSFLASPFWFNPLTLDWDVVVTDYGAWLRWMHGRSGGPSKSWSMWWTEENSFYKTMPITSKLVFVIKAILYILMEEGIRRSDLFQADIVLNTPTISVGLILMLLVVLFVVSRIFTVTGHMMTYPIRRTIGILLFLLFITGVLIVFIEDSNWLRYTLAAYYGIGALCLLGLMAGLRLVKPIYMIHDYVCGHLLFIPLFILGALQLPRHIQSWLLYHNALSSNVVVSDILRYARKTQENMAGVQAADEDLVEQIAELKKIVQKQEIALQSAGLLGEQSPNAVANLVSSASEDYVDPTPQTQQPAQRTLSMSGMDVWGDMALGDVAPSVGNEQFRPQTSQPPPPPQAPSSSGDFSFAQPEQPPPR
jgi:callose synthase